MKDLEDFTETAGEIASSPKYESWDRDFQPMLRCIRAAMYEAYQDGMGDAAECRLLVGRSLEAMQLLTWSFVNGMTGEQFMLFEEFIKRTAKFIGPDAPEMESAKVLLGGLEHTLREHLNGTGAAPTGKPGDKP